MGEKNEHVETFKVNAEGKGWPTSVKILGTDWTIQVDEPVEDGGTNSGANPMQYFAASLVACQNEQAQVVASELGVTISKINIEASIDLDLSGFMGMADHSDASYKQVKLDAIVTGNLTKAQVETLGSKVDKRCPILALLRAGGCEINSSWGLS